MNIQSMSEILKYHPDLINIQKLRRPGIVIKDIDKNKKEVVMYNIDYQKDIPYSQKVSIASYQLYYSNSMNDFARVLYNYIQQVKYNIVKQFGFEPLIFVGEPFKAMMTDAIEITFTAFNRTKNESVIKLGEFYT